MGSCSERVGGGGRGQARRSRRCRPGPRRPGPARIGRLARKAPGGWWRGRGPGAASDATCGQHPAGLSSSLAAAQRRLAWRRPPRSPGRPSPPSGKGWRTRWPLQNPAPCDVQRDKPGAHWPLGMEGVPRIEGGPNLWSHLGLFPVASQTARSGRGGPGSFLELIT